jgi:hypothetical protein
VKNPSGRFHVLACVAEIRGNMIAWQTPTLKDDNMYQWIVFLHILGALVFFTAHGASAAMAFQLRREQGLERIRAILDLSNAALPIAYTSVMVLVLAGIVAGIMGRWFSQGWIWVALLLMVIMWFGMHYYAFRFYTPIRKAVGLPYRDGTAHQPPQSPAPDAEIAALIQASRPGLLAGGSFALVALILWLMIFKPF